MTAHRTYGGGAETLVDRARHFYEQSRKRVSGRPPWHKLNPLDPYDMGMRETALEEARAEAGAVRPIRLLLSRQRGFDLQALSRSINGLPAASCSRPYDLGNPFPTDVYGQEGAVDRFRRLMAGQMSPLEKNNSCRADRWADRGVSLVTVREFILEALAGKRAHNLACWCHAGTPCHVDVLLELVASAGLAA